jgi:hypothetical protein
VDDFRQREQFGTGLYSSSLNRINVDGEAQFVIFKKELDPAATLRKLCTLPNHERTRTIQTVQYFRETLFFSPTNENKLTWLQLRRFIDSPGHHLAVVDCLSSHDLIECAAKWVVSKDADRNRSLFTLKSSWRPFDEFCKVQKKRCFQLIFDRRTGLGLGWSYASRRPRTNECTYGKQNQPEDFARSQEKRGEPGHQGLCSSTSAGGQMKNTTARSVRRKSTFQSLAMHSSEGELL